ncbi:Uncharacterised protein [Actinobacillus lignieresii]|uniref:HEPN domain-containing protein n=1 Tax=Actinobacillus lignieresii TaxID=720 RepID=UPI000F6D5200|nr:HEPN domain-containing protein [Actinobacillus lignieresii]VEB26305.1 Uncharacterised protein [Actinobacillus lignieresii]
MQFEKILTNLESFYKTNRDIQGYNDNFRLRIHRSLSWLKKASVAEDLDTQFIALWIAFNAAYARDLDDITRDRATFNEFLLRICLYDDEKVIYNIIWKKFSNSIRMLTDNQYIFQPFWDFHNQKITEKEYRVEEMREREKLLSSLEKQNTELLLDVLFRRLYTLRNQILHGGSTFNSKANREQLRDGCDILIAFIPAMLEIMMQHHNDLDWGKPFYPYIQA